ncbi:MAG: hypothetical protein AAFQ61_00500 [Cyanobacteria bacterium J06626_23]
MNPSYPSDPANTSLDAETRAAYAPSVPLSVYRELATELQATKAMVDSLGTQNQHLAKQNQLLRQEIHRVVQSTLQLGQYAGVAHPTDGLTPPEPIAPPASTRPMRRPPASAPPAHSATSSTAEPTRSSAPRSSNNSPLARMPKFFTEQAGERKRFDTEASGPREMSGLWLVLSITVIILTAFGAGFLIMRPLLSDR